METDAVNTKASDDEGEQQAPPSLAADSGKEDEKIEDESVENKETKYPPNNSDKAASPEAESTGGDEAPAPVPKKRKSIEKAVIPNRKKPRDAPRRPLSAYNLYFKNARALLIAKNDAGEPDDDFVADLDAIVAAKGKARDDPSAIFQAASRTLAARWKKMDHKEKVEYEKEAEEEMKKYRDRVSAYESRMVEEARQKSLEKLQEQDAAHDASNLSTVIDALNSNRANGNISAAGALPSIQLTSATSALLHDQASLQGLAYTLLQPGLQGYAGLGGLAASQVIPSDSLYLGGASDAALIAQLLQNQSGAANVFPVMAAPTSFVSYPGQAAPALASTLLGNREQSYEESIVAFLHREKILERQFSLARAANAPVATVILPPGTVRQQVVVQLPQQGQKSSHSSSPSASTPPHPDPAWLQRPGQDTR